MDRESLPLCAAFFPCDGMGHQFVVMAGSSGRAACSLACGRLRWVHSECTPYNTCALHRHATKQHLSLGRGKDPKDSTTVHTLSLSLCVSDSLSLSLSHTHTHTPRRTCVNTLLETCSHYAVRARCYCVCDRALVGLAGARKGL